MSFIFSDKTKQLETSRSGSSFLPEIESNYSVAQKYYL
jgi:hypothetical protein